jgi:hypothetical protein
MAAFEIERTAADGLSGQVWKFHVEASYSSPNVAVMCVYYAEMERPSTRHKMRVKAKWDNMDERSYHSTLTRDDVPLPGDIRSEAKERIDIVVGFRSKVGR